MTDEREQWEGVGRRRRRALPTAALAAFAAIAVLAVGALSTAGDDTLAIDGDAPSPTVEPNGPDEPEQPEPAAEPAAAQPGHWQPIDSGRLGARQGVSAAWTGTQLLVWGGRVDARHVWFGDGAAYNPRTNRWAPMSRSPLTPRAGAATAWTGKELMVWGGVGSGRNREGRRVAKPLADGAAYTPRTDTWRRLPRSPLGARRDADGIWTGTTFVVWGGREFDGSYLINNGAAYDPGTDSWKRLPRSPIRDDQITEIQLVAIGDELLVWATSVMRHTTAAYNLRTGEWREISAPPQRQGVAPQLVAVGGNALMWGEDDDGEAFAMRFAAGDPLWVSVPTPPRAPGPAEAFVSAGARAVAWQGAEGVAFDTVLNAWSGLPEAPALGPGGPTAAWTGRQLLVWHSGGRPGGELRGALWTPGNPWQPLAPPEPVAAGASAVWTGWREDDQQLLVWGGVSDRRSVVPGATAEPISLGGRRPPDAGGRSDGFAYNAALGLWENLPPAPLTPRYDHAAVWTGNEMIVLGGGPDGQPAHPAYREGAAYDPVTRRWREIAPLPVPVREGGAVWTRRRLAAAGVSNGKIVAAFYDPVEDSWTSLPEPPLPDDAAQVVTVWSDLEVWTVAIYRDGRVEAAAWSSRRRSWRMLPSTAGLQGPVAYAWTGGRLFLVDASGKTRSYGRGGTFWRRSPRVPILSERLAVTWNGYSLLALDPVTGDMATLGPRATAWTSFPDPDLSGSPAAALISTGRDVFAVGAGDVAVLTRAAVTPSP